MRRAEVASGVGGGRMHSCALQLLLGPQPHTCMLVGRGRVRSHRAYMDADVPQHEAASAAVALAAAALAAAALARAQVRCSEQCRPARGSPVSDQQQIGRHHELRQPGLCWRAGAALARCYLPGVSAAGAAAGKRFRQQQQSHPQ